MGSSFSPSVTKASVGAQTSVVDANVQKKSPNVGNPKLDAQDEAANTRSAWLTAAEAAEYLRVKPRSLLLWARQGKIPGHALSGTKRKVWRFRTEDLDSALLAKPVQFSASSVRLERTAN